MGVRLGAVVGPLVVAFGNRVAKGSRSGSTSVYRWDGMTDLGAVLRAARAAAGVSLAAMGARTHYSKPLLGLLETGKRTIRPEHVEAYSRVLDVPIEILQGPPDDPLRVAHEWLVSDSPTVVQLRAGRRVGVLLADELETRVIELRHLDDVIGGGDLFPVVSKELSEVHGVVQSASYTDEVGRRLLTVTGELAQLAGWVASDAGRYIEAQRIYLVVGTGGLGERQKSGSRWRTTCFGRGGRRIRESVVRSYRAGVGLLVRQKRDRRDGWSMPDRARSSIFCGTVAH